MSKKRFLEMEHTRGEDTVKIVEVTIKDLEYYINLVAKAGTDARDLCPSLPCSRQGT